MYVKIYTVYTVYAWACFEQDRWHVAGVSLAPPAGYNHCVQLIQPLNCRLSHKVNLKHNKKNQIIHIKQKKNKMKESLSHNFIEMYDVGLSPRCCLLISRRIWLRKEILFYYSILFIFSLLTYSVVCVCVCFNLLPWIRFKKPVVYVSDRRKHPQGLDGPNTTRTPLTPGKDGGPPCSTDTNEVMRHVTFGCFGRINLSTRKKKVPRLSAWPLESKSQWASQTVLHSLTLQI